MGQALGQVHAVGLHFSGQACVLADQQLQAALAGDPLQRLRLGFRIGGPEAAVDDPGASGQPPRGRGGIGRAFGVGEEQQRRQRLSQRAPGR
jgi:hypothetical protein